MKVAHPEPLNLKSATWDGEHECFSRFSIGYTPHDYQQTAFDTIMGQIASGEYRGKQLLYISPTGTGKSIIELMILGSDPYSFLITPRIEIITGMLEKLGFEKEYLDGLSDAKLVELAGKFRISTPIRYRNQLAKGELSFRPLRLLRDEGHHSPAMSHQQIKAYLPGVMLVDFTATGMRGTNNGTAEFLDSYTDVYNVLTIPQACERGVWELPEVHIWPLVDDDEITIQNGDFRPSTSGHANRSRFRAVADAINNNRWVTDFRWDRPTMFSVPTTDNVSELAYVLDEEDIPSVTVTQDTPREERMQAFRAAVNCEVAIVQINVVSEGVDLPMRRLIDMSPTMSPVKWLQQIGRITRPLSETDLPSQYVCTNRNLERHSYLMCGLIKPAMIAEAQTAFPMPTARIGARAIGLEGIGKFAATELYLADGVRASMYCVYAMEGFVRTEYAILVHPCVEYPLYAEKRSVNDNGVMRWGKWRRIESIPDIRGFQSSPKNSLSDAQRAWWNRAALAHGLDDTRKVTTKNFQALPILADTRCRLQIGGF